MIRRFASSRPLKILLVLLMVGCTGVAAILALHKQRKQAAMQAALVDGTAAYDAKDYTRAAAELGRYLTANRRDCVVLMKYADAQIRRRPQTKESIWQAMRALETVVRIDPAYPEAAERLTELYLLLGAPLEAEHIARAWRAASPQEAGPRRQLAAALLRRQKTEEALAELKSIAAEFPDEVRCWRMLAFIHFQKGDPVSAEQTINEAVEKNPHSAAARLAKANLMAATLRLRPGSGGSGGREAQSQPADPRERTQRVIAELDEAARLGSDDPGTLLELGKLYMDFELLDKASAQFDLAEKVAPDNPGVYLARGKIILEEIDDPAAGAALADRMVAAPLGEQQFDILPMAVEFYAGAGRFEDALKCIQSLRDRGASLSILRYAEGVLALATEEPFKAAAALEEAVRRSPQYARAHLLLGRSYVRTGNPRRAIAPFREYVRLRQSEGMPAVSGQFELAGVYWAIDKHEEALDAVKKALASATRISQVNRAGLTVFKIEADMARPGGKKPDSSVIESHCRDLARLFAQNPGLSDNPSMQILFGRLTAWRGDLDGAVEILTSARERFPKRLDITQALMEIYADAGKYDEAIAECRTAVDAAEPSRVPAWTARLASLYSSKGDWDSARQTLESAVGETAGVVRKSLRMRLARLLLQQKQVDQARQILATVAGENADDLPTRLMLLAIQPGPDESPSRQQLLEEVKRIEGPNGLNWRYWQAALWLGQEDWASHRKEIQSLLEECLARDPEWDAAILAMGDLYEKTRERYKTLDLYNRGFASNVNNALIAARLLYVAAEARRWNEVDQVLDRFPPNVADAKLQKFVQHHRLLQAMRRGDTEGAIALLRSRLADASDYQARLQLASILRSRDDNAQADQLLAEASRIAPDAPEVLSDQVDQYLEANKFEEALRLCDQAVAKNPGLQTYTLRARVREATGDVARAEEDLGRVAEVAETAEEGYLVLGRLRSRHGRYAQARESWRKGLAAVPDSVRLRTALAEVLIASGDENERQEGERLVNEWLAEHPDDEAFLLMRADILFPKDPRQAQAICEKVAEAHPDSVGAYGRLAQMAVARGQVDRALEMIDRAFSGSGSRRDVRLLLLQSRLHLSKSPSRAVLAAREALSIQPKNELAAIALRDALVSNGEADKAFEALRGFLSRSGTTRMVEVRLSLADLYISAARMYYKTQNSSKAEEAIRNADDLIEQARALAPDKPGVVAARLLWHHAQGQWEQLISLAREHLRTQPDDLATAGAAGSILLQAENPAHREVAIEMYKQIVSRRPNDAAGYSVLGLACRAVGRIAEARSAFERGLAVDPDNVGLANDLSWVLCEDEKKPEAAAELVDRVIKAGADEPYLC